MAYYPVTTSNAAVTGTAGNDIFELAPSSVQLTGVVINAEGGTDTVQVNDASGYGVQAIISGLNPSSMIQLPSGTNGYYSQEPDGISLVDESGKINIKLLGLNDHSIFYQGDTHFYARTKTSTANATNLPGTPLSDYLVLNHNGGSADGYGGDDTIIATGYGNELYGYSGNDVLIAYGGNNDLEGDTGNDVIISMGENNYLSDYYGNEENLFIVSGNNDSAVGARAYGVEGTDTFWIYSYSGGTTNVSLTGGIGNNNYVISTGLGGVDGQVVGTAAYNPYSTDTVNVAISNFDSLDTLYLRDLGMVAIGHEATANGLHIFDNTGRINIYLPNEYDWNAVKNAKITYDDAQGNIGTLTLEQAQNFWQYKAPAGVYISGDYLNISSEFVGSLIMSGEAMNYQNGNIVTIDAQSNPQSGMFIGGNENTNAIYAGYGGNFLWGGAGFNTADYLVGGAGADIFLTGKNDGNDVILNADINDTVQLYDTNLSDIVSFGGDDNSITLGYNTGNFTNVATSGTLTTKFQLADGSAYRFNRATASWQTA